MLSNDQFIIFDQVQTEFSNFYPAKIEINGMKFSCSEQYIHYSKAILFGDKETGEKILKEEVPSKMLLLGREIRGFNENLWLENREKIMFDAHLAKYTQNEDLKQKLIETNPKEIVVAHPKDMIWAVGLPIDDANIFDKSKWKGTNLLGKTLVNVRNHIMKST